MAKSGGNSSKKERVNLRKKLLENGSLIGSSKVDHVPFENNLIRKERIENKEHKLSGKKRKEKNYSGADVDKVDQLGSPGEDVSKKLKYEESIEGKDEKKKRKLSKKKREKQNVNGADVDDINQPAFEVGDSSKKLKHGKSIEGKEEKKKKKLSKKIEKQNVNGANVYEFHHPFEVVDSTKKPKRKTKKAVQKEKKDEISSGKVTQQIKEESRSVASEVYQISSVDVDPSKGMKKWITEYHQRRPGLNILQQRIDEFITSHEEREEQAKAHSAEEGWTVVEHHKGRKRTTDAESGVAVGSVAQAAVLDKMGKKKVKDVGPDFYRFQRREAQRNEIMMLQSKFEQDKKRIQQLRAARKFRPY